MVVFDNSYFWMIELLMIQDFDSKNIGFQFKENRNCTYNCMSHVKKKLKNANFKFTKS